MRHILLVLLCANGCGRDKAPPLSIGPLGFHVWTTEEVERGVPPLHRSTRRRGRCAGTDVRMAQEDRGREGVVFQDGLVWRLVQCGWGADLPFSGGRLATHTTKRSSNKERFSGS